MSHAHSHWYKCKCGWKGWSPKVIDKDFRNGIPHGFDVVCPKCEKKVKIWTTSD